MVRPIELNTNLLNAPLFRSFTRGSPYPLDGVFHHLRRKLILSPTPVGMQEPRDTVSTAPLPLSDGDVPRLWKMASTTFC